MEGGGGGGLGGGLGEAALGRAVVPAAPPARASDGAAARAGPAMISPSEAVPFGLRLGRSQKHAAALFVGAALAAREMIRGALYTLSRILSTIQTIREHLH